MIYIYDTTYPGLLTAIFESYRLKTPPVNIVAEDQHQDNLFDTSTFIQTDTALAKRVIKGVEKKCGKDGARLMYRCFLSEYDKIEMDIYRFIQAIVESKDNVLTNFADESVLRLHQINKQIGREVHRMHAFVRFQETKDGLYAALIEPDFNVMPLIGKHFKDRYPAQDWLIYDPRRHYGIHSKALEQKSRFVTFSEKQHRHLTEEILTEAESDYQELWKSYFKAVDIPERKNMKLHLQHVPKRYWKYLVEKW